MGFPSVFQGVVNRVNRLTKRKDTEPLDEISGRLNDRLRGFTQYLGSFAAQNPLACLSLFPLEPSGATSHDRPAGRLLFHIPC